VLTCFTLCTIHMQHLGEGGSGVVQTAWALLGLLAGGCTDKAALDRGRDFLMRRQLPTGDWAQEGITGVFNRSCGITYTAYRNLFPMWALARYAAIYESADE
jgi:squalene cyclase